MKIYRLLILFLPLLLVSCASTPDNDLGYLVKNDEFQNTTRYSMLPAGDLPGAPMLSLSQAFIEIFADKRSNNQFAISLAVILHFEDWLFINPGESLVMMVDGEAMRFRSPTGSIHNRGMLKGLAGAVGGVRVREEAHYPIKTDQIKKLAYASNVKLRIYGKNGYVERVFDPDHHESIKSYYENFIAANGISSI